MTHLRRALLAVPVICGVLATAGGREAAAQSGTANSITACALAVKPDLTISFRSFEGRLAFLQSVTSDQFREMRNRAQGAVVVDGVPLGADVQQFERFKERLTSEYRFASSTSSLDSYMRSDVSDAAWAAYERCLRVVENAPVQIFRRISGAGGSNITLTVDYRPVFTGAPPEPFRPIVFPGPDDEDDVLRVRYRGEYALFTEMVSKAESRTLNFLRRTALPDRTIDPAFVDGQITGRFGPAGSIDIPVPGLPRVYRRNGSFISETRTAQGAYFGAHRTSVLTVPTRDDGRSFSEKSGEGFEWTDQGGRGCEAWAGNVGDNRGNRNLSVVVRPNSLSTTVTVYPNATDGSNCSVTIRLFGHALFDSSQGPGNEVPVCQTDRDREANRRTTDRIVCAPAILPLQ